MRYYEITEAIPLSLGKEYSKNIDKSIYDEIFNKYREHIIDKRAQRLKFDLGKTDDLSNILSNQILRNIISHIRYFNNVIALPDLIRNKESKSVELIRSHPFYQTTADLKILYSKKEFDEKTLSDYNRGVIRFNNREIRIGKILDQLIKWYEQKLIPTMKEEGFSNYEYVEEMRDEIVNTKKQFMSDNARFGKGTKDMSVIISRHPYDIAGASTGRSWSSCLNLIDGKDRRYIKDYAQNSLIAYLVDSDDLNIQRPHGRVWINRYFNYNGDFILMASEGGYGNLTNAFHEFVQKFIMDFNQGKEDGLYCSKPSAQYDYIKYKKRNEKVTPVDPFEMF